MTRRTRTMIFSNRTEAGRYLASKLMEFAGRPYVIVLALPRGGVPVAYEVARALRAPLDVFLVRKLSLPGRPELAMGAIASGGVRVLNEEVVRGLRLPKEVINAVSADEQKELERRERLYRGVRPLPEVRGRTVILLDDGLATGSTMRAAVEALRQQHPAQIVVAVPIGAPETCEDFEKEADKSSAQYPPSRSTPSACGTGTSRRPQTRRFANCSIRSRLSWSPSIRKADVEGLIVGSCHHTEG